MFCLAHTTDIHLDHRVPLGFPEHLSASGAAAVVITGDIATSDTFPEHLAEVAEDSGLPLDFVLGNHDYYGSTRALTHREASTIHARTFGKGSVHWLREAGVVDLGEGVALVGIDGLYDAGLGSPEAGMHLNDFMLIGDFKLLHRRRIIETVQAWGREDAARGRELLRSACHDFRRVFFATHVPPFPEAVRDKHGGPRPLPEALPWYCARAMGEMLFAVATEHQKTEIVVLCGHTHQAADEQIAPNLRVMVGKAQYGAPALANLFQAWPGMKPGPARS